MLADTECKIKQRQMVGKEMWMLTADWPAAQSRWAWPGRQSRDRGYRWAGWPTTWIHASATEDNRTPHILLWDCSAWLPAERTKHERAWQRREQKKKMEGVLPGTEAVVPPRIRQVRPVFPTCTPAQPPSSSTAPETEWPTPRWTVQTPHSRCHGLSETRQAQTSWCLRLW